MDLDKESLKILTSYIDEPWVPKYSNGAEYYYTIKGLRKDIQGFSAVDVIKKDLKYGSVGGEQFAIGSAPVSLKKIGIIESVGKLKAFAGEMKAFILANEIQSAFVLAVPEDGLSKQIVTATSAEDWKHIKGDFENTIASDKMYGDFALNGRRIKWPVDGVGEELEHEGFVYSLFEFNKDASRKQVLPAVQDFFASHPRATRGAAQKSRGAGRSLPEFVGYVKTQVAAQIESGSGKVPVVMGNEAGDLDSMASALVLAYFKSEHDGCAVFPVINVPRDELRLRKDNCEVFSVANISQEDLIFITEIPLEKLASDGRLQLTIVDHNELSPRQDFLAKSVVAILDHHKDAGLYKDTVGKDGRRNVQFPNGSATSLIAEVLNKDDDGKAVLADPSANLLLQSTIMLDTDNLTNRAKTENLDRAGLEVLKSAVTSEPWAPKYSARAEYYEKIKVLRQDIEGFSAVDVIKKDLKHGSVGGEQFAIGSAPVSLEKIGIVESLHTLKAFAGEMKSFIQANEIQLAFVLATVDGGDYKQIVTATSAEEWAHIKEGFGQTIASDQEYGGIALKGRRAKWPVEGVGEELAHEGFVYSVFEFVKAASRKQILPAVQDFFANHARAKRGAAWDARRTPPPSPLAGGTALDLERPRT